MIELQDPEILRAILQSLPRGVCLLGKDMKVVFWNEAAETTTGYMSHEVVGHVCRDNVLAHCGGEKCDLCGVACPFSGAIRDGKPREARMQLRHKQGHRIPVRVQVAPIRSRHASVLGVAVSFEGQRSESDGDRRHHSLAAYGCLDQVTGIPNHEFTQFHLRENLAGFTQYCLPFGVMLIEVDQLEKFQSSYGRPAGDAILRVVAQTMRSAMRPSDFLGRWTENQFLGIMLNCDLAGAQTVGERARKVVGRAGLQWWGDELPVTTSIGNAAAQPDDTAETLLERAQHCLKRALTARVPAKDSAAGACSTAAPISER